MFAFKKYLKIILDVIMTIIFMLLLNTAATGLEFHEIAGLSILGLFLFHNLLNINWIIGVTKSVFKRKAKTKTVAMYIVDALLTVFLITTALSGVFISRVLFPDLNAPFVEFWDVVHSPLAYMSLILISIHLGLHWQYIMAFFRKLFALKNDSILRRRVSRLAALIVVLFGIKSSVENNIAGKIIPQLSSGSVGTAEASEKTIAEYNTSDSSQDTQVASSTQSSDTTQSLEEYLGSLYCTGCHKHCSLLSPQCSIGVKQAQEAKTAYYESVANEVATTSETTSTATTNEQDDTQSTSETSSSRRRGRSSAASSASDTTTGTGGTTTSASETTTGTTSAAAGTDFSVISSVQNIMDPFAQYVPIMGVWIAGVHYFIMAKEKRKNVSV